MRAGIAMAVLVLGSLAGAAAGVLTRSPVPDADLAAPGDAALAAREAEAGTTSIKLDREIIVPVVDGGTTRALMLFEIALAMADGGVESVHSAEPRLRDAFLGVLLELSTTGAFDGTYTDERVVGEVRDRLRQEAVEILGDAFRDVLFLQIVRQEIAPPG